MSIIIRHICLYNKYYTNFYKDEEYPYIYGSSWWQGFYTDGSDPNYQDNDTSTVHLVDGGAVWGLEEDISLRNTVMSEEEFLNCAWLYCPGTPSKGKTKLWVTYEDFQKSNLIQGAYGTNSKINKSNAMKILQVE